MAEGESVLGDSEAVAAVGANGTAWQPSLLTGRPGPAGFVV